MANATADRDAKRQDGKLRAGKMAAVRIFKGVLCSFNSAGYVTNGSDSATDNAFAGISYEAKDNSAGAAGDLSIRLEKTGEYELNYSGVLTQADVGKVVYVLDNTTVGLTGASVNHVACGTIAEVVSAGKARVRIDGYAR